MNNVLHNIMVVFKKEWRDAIRDGRSLRLAFLPPIYFVAMFVGTFFLVLHLQNEATGKGRESIVLPVSGADRLPSLMAWLQEQGIKINQAEGDVYTQVEQKKIDYALIIPSEAPMQFATGESVAAWLVFDATNNKAQTSLHFIKQQIMNWNSRMGGLRLLSRGISPVTITPISIREINVASDQKMGFFVMASLPLFLIVSVFIASVGFTADMTAGERERRSLEALLITPVSSVAIIAGKWLTCLLLTLSVLILEIVLLAVAFAFMPFNQMGLRVDVSITDLLGIFMVLASLAVLAVSLQQVIALSARSFKDAQTYMSLMIVVPMLPMLYTMINPSAHESWFVWVPVLGHQAVIKELLLGGIFDIASVIIFWLLAIPSSMILLMITAKKLRKPNIVYS